MAIQDVLVALPRDASGRKDIPITTGVLDYFPAAVAEIARVSKAGNDQHNPGQPLHWARGKSSDHADCITRHLIQRGTVDTDGMRHTAKMAWRALALLQEEIEAEHGFVPSGDTLQASSSATMLLPCADGAAKTVGNIVLLDVDQVVADLHTEWLRRYNMDWDDDLKSEDIVAWDVANFVKPECGKRIYSYLRDADLYDNVKPMPGAEVAVAILKSAGFRVVFVTAANDVAAGAKMRWLVKHRLASSYDEIVVATDKSLIHGDFFVDDYYENLRTSRVPVRLLLSAPYNQGLGEGDVVRVGSIAAAADFIIASA